MTQLSAQTLTAGQHAVVSASKFTTDRRRMLQLALAAIWVFDGLLQYQTYMFTTGFGKRILAPTADGNPGWIAHSILWSAGIVEANPVPTNLAFATLQLAIGLAIAWRRSVKLGLAVSVVWSLLVWWFGEGVGGLLVGGASALAGAPGAVLLYLVLSVLLWPTLKSSSKTFVAAQPVGRPAATIIWIALWSGLAALNFEPANLGPGGVHAMVAGMGDGQPRWLASLIDGFAGLAAHNGTVLTVVGTVILFLVAIGILLPRRWARTAVIAGVVVSLFIWVVGEALGGLFGGQGTDVNSGPLLALIALAYWPASRVVEATGADGVEA